MYRKMVMTISLLVALLFFSSGNSISVVRSQGENPPQITGVTNPTTMLYQGYVTVSDTPHSGTGYFKFAVVNSAGTTTYWSNNGSSTGGGQPTASVALNVDSGYFGVLLGNTSLAGMTQPLSASVFSASGRHLRVWFATSSSGPFTQLPLVPFGAVPYALNAETLDGLDSSGFSLSNHNHWGGSWSGSNPGLSLYGTSVITSTLYARNTTSSAAIYGDGNGYGIYGTSRDGYGIYGTSRDREGVKGVSTGGGLADNGVVGETNSTSSSEAGVYGYSASSAAGVIGASDSGIGIRAESYYTSTDAQGVRGWTWLGYGVYGATWDGKGVYGEAWNDDGGTFHSWYGGNGVYAESRWGYGAYISNTLYVRGNLIATGSKSGYVVDIVLNVDETPLQPGDVVAVTGVTDPILGDIPVMQVRRATSTKSTAVVGVVDQLFVYDGKPEIILSECVKQTQALEDRTTFPTAISQLGEETDRPLPSGRAAETLPLPQECRISEGLINAVDGIQPGQYLSVVTLGAYKAIKVDATYGAIQPGDLLVASPNPGYAMKANDPQLGTIIGKALAAWSDGTGVVPVLVTLD